MTDSKNLQFVGWDIGGANLKVAKVGADGSVLSANQYATPLWLGLESLAGRLEMLARDTGSPGILHALTMTGEMVDEFADRSTGVLSLLRLFARFFSSDRIMVYTIDRGLVSVEEACAMPAAVASANWQATAAMVARQVDNGILVDIGTTTTDIVPFRSGRPCAQGVNDQQRLRCGELVYSGVVRTPVMAIVQRAPFAGHWQSIAAEYFASMADVYRVTGQLDERSDLHDSADHRGKSFQESVCRLARMLGTEPVSETEMEQWILFANYVAEQQLQLIDESFLSVRSRFNATSQSVIVGAGCGAFIAAMIAERHGHEYIPLHRLLVQHDVPATAICTCAPAIAVAQLARSRITQ